MYMIVIYDVTEKRVNKVHKYLKQKLNWIQNSVFEWEISDSEFVLIKEELKKMIKKFRKEFPESESSIIIFNMPYKGALDRTVIWDEKNPIDNMI